MGPRREVHELRRRLACRGRSQNWPFSAFAENGYFSEHCQGVFSVFWSVSTNAEIGPDTGWKRGDLVFQHGVGVVSMASSSELHNHHLGLASLADHDFVFASPYMQADLSYPREVFSSYSRLLSNADRAVAMGARSLVHGGRLRST